VSRSFATYYVAGVLFTLAYRYANWLTAGIDVPFAPGPNTLSEIALGPISSVSDLAVGFFWDSPFIITTSTRRPGG